MRCCTRSQCISCSEQRFRVCIPCSAEQDCSERAAVSRCCIVMFPAASSCSNLAEPSPSHTKSFVRRSWSVTDGCGGERECGSFMFLQRPWPGHSSKVWNPEWWSRRRQSLCHHWDHALCVGCLQDTSTQLTSMLQWRRSILSVWYERIHSTNSDSSLESRISMWIISIQSEHLQSLLKSKTMKNLILIKKYIIY